MCYDMANLSNTFIELYSVKQHIQLQLHHGQRISTGHCFSVDNTGPILERIWVRAY